MVGVVWLPKFPRTSAEFPPSAAATHVRASVISLCQVGSEKPPSTAFTMSVCAFYHATGCYHPQISFRKQFFQDSDWGIPRKRETQRSDKASSAVESQCRAAEQRGFLPASASAAARNYLGSRLTWKGSIDPRPLNKALRRSTYPMLTMEDILPSLSKLSQSLHSI